MFDRVREMVLRGMRVPGEPHPPAGAPNSVRVFRAGKNFFKFRLFTWSIGQTVALATLIFWSVMLWNLQRTVDEAKLAAQAKASAPASPVPVNPVISSGERPAAGAVETRPKAKSSSRPRRSSAERVAANVPPWLIPFLRVAEAFGFLSYLVQLTVTYAVLRLDYESRWYIVTDRSLRIRSGLWRMQEITMSFANIQQVVVTRGPLQGWLKLADVRVQSAGGGGSEQPGRGRGYNLHAGIFQGVDNATQIRDLILERLRRFRATGLGDPEDHHDGRPAHVPALPAATTDSDVLAAAKELLRETRALREATVD